jgi:hypothetical protein
MTNQLTEELVHWDLAELPDGVQVEDEGQDDALEPTVE